jgi:hypothetical protein
MDEATALLLTLEHTAPDAATACTGWTAHDLVAHLAAGAAEMAGLVEDALAGRTVRPTTPFEEREAPWRALSDGELREQLVVEALRLHAATEALTGLGSEASVLFSGRSLTATELTMHGRSEVALHRWDLAGDDEVSRELLRDPALTRHAVKVLNEMVDGSAEATAARAAALPPGWSSNLRLATPGQPDVVVVLDAGDARAHLGLDEPGPTPTVTMAPDARLLAVWGRRSTVDDPRWGEDQEASRALESFLFL